MRGGGKKTCVRDCNLGIVVEVTKAFETVDVQSNVFRMHSHTCYCQSCHTLFMRLRMVILLESVQYCTLRIIILMQVHALNHLVESYLR